MRIGLYARVSTHDQHTLPLQIEEMQKYVSHRQWTTTLQIEEIESGAKDRPKRDLLIHAARKRNIDVILVWRLDRWGRSASDLIMTLQELSDLNVGFISLKEALDLTTITGRAMAGLLSIFSQFERDILRERVKAGISHARKQGKPHGRPLSAAHKITQIKQLYDQGISKAEIARQLCIGRTSVRRFLQEEQFA
jgi:DNA invertase Pin-like site-specific DNA recombinase